MCKNEKVIEMIKENYKHLGTVIEKELELSSMHRGLSGHNRELMWLNFFRKIIPNKFVIEQNVMIIDSGGIVSKEVDIAVFDNQYTPYIFQYGNLKFIPIEAIAIVIECKSGGWANDELQKWHESIDKLKTSQTGIIRTIGGYSIGLTNKTQNSTRPIKILASMRNNPKVETLDKIDKIFDFIIYRKVEKNKFGIIDVKIPNIKKNLGWWGSKLNGSEGNNDKGLKIDRLVEIPKNVEYMKFEKVQTNDKNNMVFLKNTLEDFVIDDNPLLSINFQLNQLLMLINNPMLFPHFAYANLFGANK